VNINNIGHLHLAERHIHFHLCETGARCKGIILAVAGRLRGDVDRAVEAVERRRRKLRHIEKLLPALLIDNHVILDIHGVFLFIQHICRIIQDSVLENESGLLHGHTADIRLAGCVSARIKRCNIGILRRENMNFVLRNTGGLRGHLGKYRIRALSDLRSAHLQLHGAILI